MNYVVALNILVCVIAIGFVGLYIRDHKNVGKAVRYAITLRNNEGGFIGLCVKKRRGTWTFTDVRITPTNSGGPVSAAPGILHVPFVNILYYQEITEVANVSQ